MRLTWRNVSYSVRVKPTKLEKKERNITEKYIEKRILVDESGYVNPGECLFIMGPSGAGKTSLMNALCDRIDRRSHQKFQGEIMING